ncbi:MAG: DUF6326 family protein [Tannerellaceae bacterium]|jgi:hypothetical protein|nr:DUF6326 family protein [Tannerellaceae bacterium]
MKVDKTIDTRVKLSTLWIVVMINMIFADIFTIFVELTYKNTIEELPAEVKWVMAIAAIVTNVPILMIYLARVLPYKSNRLLNIIAAIFTIIYVVGGGSATPHYIIVASIEIIILLIIVVKALKWKNQDIYE